MGCTRTAALFILVLLVDSFCTTASVAQALLAEGRHSARSCSGIRLNASSEQSNSQQSVATIVLRVRNEGFGVCGVTQASWKLIIDGKEINDFQLTMMFGNGPGPVGGTANLHHAETFGLAFTPTIHLFRYLFPERRKYQFAIKDKNFATNTVNIEPYR